MQYEAPNSIDFSPSGQGLTFDGEFDFIIEFTGYDPQIHQKFDLVQRFIGRKGSNLTCIWDGTGAKALVRGKGTETEEHLELQLAVKCPSKLGRNKS